MDHITKNLLVTMNLKYGAQGQSLQVIAMSQFVIKALYYAQKPIASKELASTIAHLVGVAQVSQTHVSNAASYLEKRKIIEKHGSTWSLTEQTKDEVGLHIRQEEYSMQSVLSKYFTSISSPNLREWFSNAAAVFFGYYGEEWLTSVNKGKQGQSSSVLPLADILAPTIRQFNLEDNSQKLIQGFGDFLSSSNIADQEYLMSMGQSMFSARLAAAQLGVDLLTLDELRSSMLLLDTNVLVAIALESKRLDKKSIEALAKALGKLGCRLTVLNATKQEYLRIIDNKRNNAKNLCDKYSPEILQDVQDDFIRTGALLGCVTPEDYNRFFDTIAGVPTSLNGTLAIKPRDDEEIIEIEKQARNNTQLKHRLKTIASEYSRLSYTKPSSALEHDAVLLEVVNTYRTRGELLAGLSFDRSLHLYAQEAYNTDTLPHILLVDALIQILALDDAGLDVDAANFAPLLASIILNKCMPAKGTYALEDLHWLLRMNHNASELSADEQRRFLGIVKKARLTGKDVSDPELQLEVQRAFEKTTIFKEEEVQAAYNKKDEAEQALAQARTRESKIVDKLVANRIKKILLKERLKLVGKVILGGGIIVILLIAFYLAIRDESTGNVNLATAALLLFSGIAGLLEVFVIIPKSLQTYYSASHNAKVKAQKEIGSEFLAE